MDNVALLLLVPLFSAIVLLFFKTSERSISKIAFTLSIVSFGLVLFYWYNFNPDGGVQYVVDLEWIPGLGARLHMGVDGIAMSLVLLTNVLIPFIIGASFGRGYSKSFYSLVFLMQSGLLLVFTALDAFLFYVGWELALIPIYFICALWGGENRRPISLKFFIYTFTGSLFMLVSIIYLYFQVPNADFGLASFYALNLDPSVQTWVFWGFLLAFAIKIPIFPFHTWQPDTYTMAPIPGTMLLAGIMLKMGLFGLIRWLIPIAPDAFLQFKTLIIVLAIIGIVYASIIALKQKEAKRLIAYSSMAHVGLIAAGIFAWNTDSLQGSVLQMFNHGLNVVGLFLCLDVIQRQTGTLNLYELGGIAKRAPKLAVLFFIILLGSIGLPLTNGFVGEFLLLSGLYEYRLEASLFAGLTIILGAAYMLRLYQHLMLGEVSVQAERVADVRGAELILLSIIALLVLVLGLYPSAILNLSEAGVRNLMTTTGF